MPPVSMTGYGRAADPDGLVVEIRTVNHRHLDIHCRLPKALAAAEADVKREVQSHLKRGRVDITASLERGGGGDSYSVNHDQVDRYLDWAAHVSATHGVEHTLDLAQILALPGAVVPAEAVSGEGDASERLLAVVTAACRGVSEMRREEGASLLADMNGHLDAIADAVERLDQRRPHAVRESHGRLKARVTTLCADVTVDEARLAQEVAILADRSDVSEELTRLRSHIAQFRAHLQGDGPVGRTLDFLLVEVNREANTLGAKCQDTEMVQDVVRIKGEIEKVREQVQNVE